MVESSVVGLRARNWLPAPEALHSLPSSIGAAAQHFAIAFIGRDRGLVHNKNSRTFDNRAGTFAKFLLAHSIDDERLRDMTPEAAAWILAAYIADVEQGKCGRRSKQKLQASTISEYLKSAEAWFKQIANIQPACRQADGTLTPLFRQILADRRNWQEPKEKIAALPYAFYQNFHKLALTVAWTSVVAATFDWCRLGLFTGSRVGEYAQSNARRGQFSHIPTQLADEHWAGKPIAFIAEDFTFFDKRNRILPLQTVFADPEAAVSVEIRFRYDKSPRNFTRRRFTATHHHFLCPVKAAISILLRARHLDVRTHEPVGVFNYGRRNISGRSFQYLHGTQDICKTMRSVLRFGNVFDASHYLRKHEGLVVPHCNRVSAAVALDLSGWKHERIAFKLRWSPETVSHYIRDASDKVQKGRHERSPRSPHQRHLTQIELPANSIFLHSFPKYFSLQLDHSIHRPPFTSTPPLHRHRPTPPLDDVGGDHAVLRDHLLPHPHAREPVPVARPHPTGDYTHLNTAAETYGSSASTSATPPAPR